MERFKDSGETIYSFQDEFLVQCPRCQACAIVRRLDPHTTDLFAPLFAPRRFSCKGCGASKDWAEKEIRRSSHNEPTDDYFHYALWLQAPCCGEVLWACNLQHLEFIESFVRAELRERRPDSKFGCRIGVCSLACQNGCNLARTATKF